MENTQLTVAELSSLLRMIQVIPDSDSVSRVQQMLLAFCTSWRTIGVRRAFLFSVDGHGRVLRGHLAAERAGDNPAGEEASFEALARRVVENTQLIESGDLTLRARTFTVPLDWQRCGAVKSAASGAPVLADRRLSEFGSDPLFEFLQTGTYLAVPMRVRGKVAAVLTADNGDGPDPIGVEDVSLVYSIAQQAATTIERLLDTADNSRKFRVLRKLQDVLAAVEDPKRFGDSLSATLSMTARAAGGTGALLKDLVRNRTTHVKSVDDFEEGSRDTDMAITECFEGILDRAAGTMKAIRGDSGHALLSDVASERIHHFVALPLVAGGECLGATAFYVEDTGSGAISEFSARDRLFLELCAGMLAERLDSLYRAERLERSEDLLEEARSNWTREKTVSRAGSRAQEQFDAVVSEVREVRDALRGRAPLERRIERAREVVDRIESEAETFRAELTAMNSSLERVDLFALARESFTAWAESVRPAGVEVTVHAADDGPTLLMHPTSVRTALDSILRVLAANVSKGDRVLLETSSTDGKAVLLIADTAGKVDGTLLSRLFMPFASGGDDEGSAGAMSAAGDILQRHAGEIAVKSSPSWKTILAISFPVASNRDRREKSRDRRHRPQDRRRTS